MNALPPIKGDLPGLVAYWAEKTPDADMIISGGNTLSYAQSWARITALATRLSEAGVRPGDRVGFLSHPGEA
ncbi:MAG: AMP-binding protein, partial [Hyphomonadaceae bacterium]|nr:AMP-binding protein [Hyphomonadaceae bacterium]